MPGKLTHEQLLTLDEIVTKCYKTAEEHGWWDTATPGERIAEEAVSIPEKLMLMVTEIAEAMEEYRNGSEPYYIKDGKPEGIAVELADCIIRIFDLAGFFGWDIAEAIDVKMAYNDSRPYRHGGKKA